MLVLALGSGVGERERVRKGEARKNIISTQHGGSPVLAVRRCCIRHQTSCVACSIDRLGCFGHVHGSPPNLFAWLLLGFFLCMGMGIYIMVFDCALRTYPAALAVPSRLRSGGGRCVAAC